MRIEPLYNDQGKLSHFVGVLNDITERRQREAMISRQANYDPLTNLPNRHLFIDRLRHQVKLTDRHGGHCYVLFIDLDGFKDINDTLGHGIGDELLKLAAARLHDMVRESDTVARFGGDEFRAGASGY